MLDEEQFRFWEAQGFQRMPGNVAVVMSPEQRLKAAEVLADCELAQEDFRAHLVNIYVDFLTNSNLETNLFHVNKRVAALTAKAADTARKGAERNIELQVKIADLTRGLHDLANSQDRTNRRVTAWMTVLTVLGLAVAVASMLLSWKTFELERGKSEAKRAMDHSGTAIQPPSEPIPAIPSIPKYEIGTPLPLNPDEKAPALELIYDRKAEPKTAPVPPPCPP